MASRKSHTRFEDVNFNTYIYRVLKQVHPESGMSGDGLAELNNMIRITEHRVVDSVNLLMQNSGGKKTISSREIQSAVRLTFPGELAKHSVSEATKAVTKYNSGEGGVRGRPVSRGARAGLQFPVTRVETVMMELATVRRKSATAAVYLAAVLEYVCAEILELAGNAARDAKKVRITPRHIKLAILNDSELTRLFKGVVMSGGVIPHIHSKLVPPQKEGREDKPRKVPRKTTKKATKSAPKKEKTGTTPKASPKSSPKAPPRSKSSSRVRGKGKSRSRK